MIQEHLLADQGQLLPGQIDGQNEWFIWIMRLPILFMILIAAVSVSIRSTHISQFACTL